MDTGYFFLALYPTAVDLPYFFSHSFSVTYNSNGNLARQQSDYEQQFRTFLGNPQNYNARWSNEYTDMNSADTEKDSIIQNIQANGNTVLTPDWP